MNRSEPIYRFSQAAEAIGITEAALRNWMTRNRLDLFGERPEGGWRTFTRNDIYLLALAAEMVRFGAPVNDAVTAAGTVLASMNFRTLEGMPRLIYAAPDRLGWYAAEDEGLVRSVTHGITCLKISVPECLNEARKRLEVRT